MGLIQSFIDRFKHQAVHREETLGKHGIDIESDKKLGIRLLLILKISGLLKRTDISIVAKINLLDTLIHAAAVPWLRAGDDGRFALLMLYWEKMMGLWSTFAAMLADQYGGEYGVVDKGRIRELIEHFGARNVIPYGWMIVDISMKDKDVTAQYVTIIQSSMQQGASGIQPFYKSEIGKK